MFEFATYINSLGLLQIIGVFGFLVYVTAFGSLQLGYINGNSALYSLLNILAALMVAISLVAEFNLSSALIQGSWIAFGLIGLGLRVHKNRQINRRVLSTTLLQEAN